MSILRRKKFLTLVNVVKTCLVDEDGNFIFNQGEGVRITIKEPDDNSIWICTKCGKEVKKVIKPNTQRVEITLEKTMRISKLFNVTEEQLEFLKGGINPFEEELEKEIDSGHCEYDYSVNDINGRAIVDWSN